MIFFNFYYFLVNILHIFIIFEVKKYVYGWRFVAVFQCSKYFQCSVNFLKNKIKLCKINYKNYSNLSKIVQKLSKNDPKIAQKTHEKPSHHVFLQFFMLFITSWCIYCIYCVWFVIKICFRYGICVDFLGFGRFLSRFWVFREILWVFLTKIVKICKKS